MKLFQLIVSVLAIIAEALKTPRSNVNKIKELKAQGQEKLSEVENLVDETPDKADALQAVYHQFAHTFDHAAISTPGTIDQLRALEVTAPVTTGREAAERATNGPRTKEAEANMKQEPKKEEEEEEVEEDDEDEEEEESEEEAEEAKEEKKEEDKRANPTPSETGDTGRMAGQLPIAVEPPLHTGEGGEPPLQTGDAGFVPAPEQQAPAPLVNENK